MTTSPDLQTLAEDGTTHPSAGDAEPLTGEAEPQTDLEVSTQQAAQVRRRVIDPPGARQRQHDRGRLHARDRIDVLLDPGSFVETDPFRRHVAFGAGLDEKRPHGDGVVTGFGTVNGRRTFVFAHDFTVFGGSLGATFAQKICKVMDLAIETRAPIVGINDGAGARIQEGVDALAGYGEIFRRNVRASGVIPQISVLAGPCAGGAAYSPALTDFVFMVEDVATMFVTGPDVVRTVTGEDIDADGLGGANVHTTRSGVAHFADDDEVTCLERCRALLSYLPSSSGAALPWEPTGDDPDRRCDNLRRLVPANARQSYDVRDVIGELVDRWTWLEISERWAANVVCGFARMDGHVVGVVANQPCEYAGVLDIDASEKAAAFVRVCDAFDIPLVTLVDVPGFLPGSDQEHRGLVRRGAKLLFAYCEATVPRVQVILRKAYGGAYIVMDSRSVGSDVSLAWPTNEVAVMGAEGAVDLLHRKELAAADDGARRDALIEDYRRRMMHPYAAAEHGHVDDVIDPADTRRAVIRSLRMLAGKQPSLPDRKHGTIPL